MGTPFRAATVIALIGYAACGYRFVQGESNFPDSGIVCSALPADAGGAPRGAVAGSGSLSGPRTFTVRASYEGQTSMIPIVDGGTGLQWTTFSLYEQAVACGVRLDGGLSQRALFGLVHYPVGQALGPGAYPVGSSSTDAGLSAGLYYADPSLDAGLMAAKAGTVTLTGVEACSLSGSLTSSFPEPDGGAWQLSGSFTSAYCQ